MSHEHILTKDADGEGWVVVLDMGEIRLYPFFARTSHNGHEEDQQFETFVAHLPQDHSLIKEHNVPVSTLQDGW